MPVMTAEEFEWSVAARAHLTVEELREHGVSIVPCECGRDGCPGWTAQEPQ